MDPGLEPLARSVARRVLALDLSHCVGELRVRALHVHAELLCVGGTVDAPIEMMDLEFRSLAVTHVDEARIGRERGDLTDVGAGDRVHERRFAALQRSEDQDVRLFLANLLDEEA